jgi:hypothetical protein
MLALVVLAGCALSHEADSGPRLRAVWLAPSSGERIFWRWHDTQLDVDCQFHEMPDGTLRCVPDDAWVYDGLASDGVQYADADCSMPVAVDAACDARFLIERLAPNPCDALTNVVRVWRIGPPASVSRVYQRFASGACRASAVPPTSVRPLEPMEASAFVGARVGPSTSTEAIVQDRYEADTISWVDKPKDRARGEWCSLEPAFLGELDRIPCVPDSLLQVSDTNAECDAHFATFVPSECPPPDVDVVSFLRKDRCGTVQGTEVYPVGEEVAPGSGDPACYGSDRGAFALGPRADDLVPWLDVRRPEGRLQHPIVEAAGGVRFSVWPPRDTELGFRCQPVLFDDGVYRCVPYIAESESGPYADPDCTERAIVTGDCPELRYRYLEGDPDACGGPTTGTVFGPADAIDTVYHLDPATGACTEDPRSEGHSAYRAEIVSPDELVAFERIIE